MIGCNHAVKQTRLSQPQRRALSLGVASLARLILRPRTAFLLMTHIKMKCVHVRPVCPFGPSNKLRGDIGNSQTSDGDSTAFIVFTCTQFISGNLHSTRWWYELFQGVDIDPFPVPLVLLCILKYLAPSAELAWAQSSTFKGDLWCAFLVFLPGIKHHCGDCGTWAQTLSSFSQIKVHEAETRTKACT